MTTAELEPPAARNLVETYFRLGRATPGAQEVREPGFRACLGEFRHPICNFAADLDLDPWSVRRLKQLALPRGTFNVYTLPVDRPANLSGLLERAGFRMTYRLVQMAAAPEEIASPALDLRSPESEEERTAIARFMADQFFSRQSTQFRGKVADATATAEGLELFELWDRRERAAAMMLCHTGDAVGVYNLCVASAFRGRGVGRALVRWARARAAGLPVALQCDGRLESWYRSLGFSSLGTVDVFCLSRDFADDIIESG